MRTLKVVFALLLLVAGVTGCDSGPSEDEKIQQIMDENASFSVFLRPEATDAQRAGVEAALRALPGFTGLTFTDQDAAYRKYKQMFSEAPDRMPEIAPEALPGSFEVTMTDIAAVQKVRDNESTLQGLPGVEEVSFVCTTVAECREKFSPRPSAPPS